MIVNAIQTVGQDTVTLNWELENATSYDGVRVYLYNNDSRLLLATLTTDITSFVYAVPYGDRGMVIFLGIVAFTDVEDEAVILSAATTPNPISGLLSKVFDCQVELTWTKAAGKNIKGYLVERDTTEIGVAAVNRYIDIGNAYKDPTAGNSYTYKVRTVTYDNVLSTPIELAVDVPVKINEVKTRQVGSVAIGAEERYRICSVGEDGSRSRWTTYRKMLITTDKQPHEFQFRIRAITTDGGSSLPLTSRSMVIDNDFAEEMPTFRLRVVDVDGLESDAIVVKTEDLIWKEKVLINRSGDRLLDRTDNTMVGRRL
jgi:hypothetical protein